MRGLIKKKEDSSDRRREHRKVDETGRDVERGKERVNEVRESKGKVEGIPRERKGIMCSVFPVVMREECVGIFTSTSANCPTLLVAVASFACEEEFAGRQVFPPTQSGSSLE